MNYWQDTPFDYASIELESRKTILHPYLLNQLRKGNYKNILDYGCGDGSLFDSWQGNDCEITLYDISIKMLEIARNTFKARRNVKVIDDIKLIEEKSQDAVVLSLVLMTVESIEIQEDIFRQIKRVKKDDGLLLVAITHPCFRQYAFSTFHTAFSKGREFDYFKEGQQFLVELTDKSNNKTVEFLDYHWSLGTTLNIISNAGFILMHCEELHDEQADGGGCNPYFPPYLILQFR